MPRTSAPPPIRSPRTHVFTGGNGNGSPAPTDRLTRIEDVLENIQADLAVQFQRIAELQVQLDRAIADRPIDKGTR